MTFDFLKMSLHPYFNSKLDLKEFEFCTKRDQES